VQSIAELVKIVEDLKSKGKKVIQCHGVFDGLHPGHIRHLKAAKKFGDILIVTVTPDRFVNKGPDRPRFSDDLRTEELSAIECVDYAAVNEWPTATNAILLLKPDFYVKGKEYSRFDVSGGITEESKAVESIGGSLIFTDEIVFSSSNIINKQSYSEETYNYIKTFSSRFTFDVIYDYINRISEVKVLIIGETIIDEYQYGNSLGKSGKSPVVAFNIGVKERYEGGVLAEYNHLRTFTDKVDIITDRTIVKRRYVEGGQKLFETYKFESPTMSETELCATIEASARKYDVILVSDFGHGMITKAVRNVIKRQNNLLVINAQRNAGNMGYNTIRKYWDRKDNTFFCIDKGELMLAVCDSYDDVDQITSIIEKEFNGNIIVTSGDGGCVVEEKNIPPFALNVVDSLGAGDAFLSIITPLVYLGAPKELVGFVGNVAGAMACSYAGNKEHIDKMKLCKFIETILK